MKNNKEITVKKVSPCKTIGLFILAAVLIFTGVYLALFKVQPIATAAAEDKEKRLVIDSCDYVRNWERTYTGIDDSNYLYGNSSITVKSEWPNSRLMIHPYTEENGKTNIENSGIPFSQAYLDFFFYLDYSEKLEHTAGYFKLSANPNRDDAGVNKIDPSDDQETRAEKEAFIFEFTTLNLQSGWNYVALKLSDATFNGAANQKEKVYNNLKKFVFLARSALDTANPTAGRPILTANIDEITITDTPRQVTKADLVPKYIPRNSSAIYTNAVYYTMPAQIDTYNKLALILFLAAAVVITVTFCFFSPIKFNKTKGQVKQKKTKGLALVLGLVITGAAGGLAFSGGFSSLLTAMPQSYNIAQSGISSQSVAAVNGTVIVVSGDPFIPETFVPKITNDTAQEYPYSGEYKTSVALLSISSAILGLAILFFGFSLTKKIISGQGGIGIKRGKKNSGGIEDKEGANEEN